MSSKKRLLDLGIDVTGFDKLVKLTKALEDEKRVLAGLNKIKLEGAKLDKRQANTQAEATVKVKMHTASIGKLQNKMLGLNTVQGKSNKGLMGMISTFGRITGAIFLAQRAFSLIFGAVMATVDAYAEFEKTLTNVMSLMTQSQVDLFKDDMWDTGISLVNKYGFAVKDVNKAMFDAVSAGVSASNSMGFMKTASMLAVAGVTQLKDATLGLVTILNSYKMETSEAQRVAEVLFTTQKFGVTTVEQLSKSIGIVAPLAALTGISIEELGASMATMTKGGLNTAISVTALRSALATMMKPAKESKDLFVKWGVPMGTAQMKAVGFTDTMKKLHVVLRDSPSDFEKMFGNIRGLTAVVSIGGDRFEDYKNILKEITEDTGDNSSLIKGQGEQMETTQMSLDRLSGSWETFKIAMGEDTSGMIKDVSDELSVLLNIAASDEGGIWEAIAAFVGTAYNPIMVAQVNAQNIVIQENKKLIKNAAEALRGWREELSLSGDITKEQEGLYRRFIEDYERYYEGLDAIDKVFWRDRYDEAKASINKIDTLKNEADAAKTRRQTKAGKEAQAFDAIELFLREKLEKELVDLTMDSSKSSEEINLESRNLKIKNYKTLISFAKSFGIESIEWEKLLAQETLKIKEDERKARKGLVKQSAEDESKWNKLKAEAIKTEAQAEIDAEKAKWGLKADAVRRGVDAISGLMELKASNEARQRDAELASLDERFNNGIITEERYNEEKERINKEAFSKDKKRRQAEVLLNTIQSAADVLIAQYERTAVNPVLALAMTPVVITQLALIAATSAANVAMIGAQQYALGGMVHGNTHAAGGESFAVGGRVVEMEGGEAVLNKRSTRMFRNTLSAMNVAGGGKSFSSPNMSGAGLIDYDRLAKAIGQNTHVAIPVDTLNKVQKRVSLIESSSRF